MARTVVAALVWGVVLLGTIFIGIPLSAGDPGNFLLIVFLGVALGFAAAVLIERGRRY